jgi:hypothetical protein
MLKFEHTILFFVVSMNTVPQKHLPPPRTSAIFKFHDGSILRKMSARDLAKIPVWEGNRLLDDDHKRDIVISLNGNLKFLDSKPYHLVTYPTEDDEGRLMSATCIVDGQHRVSILKEAFPEYDDFDVLVVEKQCQSYSDVVRYFKILNMTKAIAWQEDPKLCANRYIKALETKFNTKKQGFIRQGATRKPYLSIDKLREGLMACRLGQNEQDPTPEAFASLANAWNQQWCKDQITNFDPQIEKYKKLGFALAYDDKLKWIRVCLTQHHCQETHDQ